jgi:hypothetical protein
MSWALRLVQLLLLASILVLLLREAERPTAPLLHPLVPPLTRVEALGDATLGPPVPPPPRPGPPPVPDPAAFALRLQMEADAMAIAQILGPERLGSAIHHREVLSARVGETAVWADLALALAQPAGAPTND